MAAFIKWKAIPMNLIRSTMRKLAWIVGILVILVLAAHFLLPFVVNTSSLRARILSIAADQVGGQADFQVLKPALLPLPHAIVFQGRIHRPGALDMRFAKGVVYFQFWPLLHGRLKIGRLIVVDPDIVVQGVPEHLYPALPAPDRSSPSMDLQTIETITKATASLSPLAIRIKNGRLTLNRPARGDITFDNIRLVAKVTDKNLTLRVSGRSDLMGTFKFGGKLKFDGLVGNGQVQFIGLDTAHLTSLGLVPPMAPIPAMTMDLKMNFEMQGLDTINCGLQAQAPQVIIINGLRRLTVQDMFLKGDGRWTPKQFQLSVQQLQAAAPAIRLSGTAAWFAGNPQAWIPSKVHVEAIDLDIPSIRTAALKLTGDVKPVQKLFEIVQGGKMPELMVTISGMGSLGAKTEPEVNIRGKLSDGRIVLPHDMLRLEHVSGQVVMAQGRLVAKNARARLGNSLAHDGTLTFGILDGTGAFNLDTAIDVDLSELPATLKSIANSRKLAGLLDRIPSVSGRATGRLRLGDNLDHLTTKVSTTGRIKALDAALDISGTIEVPPSGGPFFGLSLDGPLGPQTVAWFGTFSGVAADWLPNAPIRINRVRITQDPSGGFGLDGKFSMVDSLQVKAALRVGPDKILTGKFHLKDAVSDAVIDYRGSREGNDWQAGFAGDLRKSTADKILRHNGLILGQLNGNLQVRFRAGAPEYNAVLGHLDFRQINCPADYPMPLRLLSGSIAGNGQRVDLSSVGFQWMDSTGQLSGNGTFTAEALNLDLTVSMDNLDADKLARLFDTEKKASGVPEPKTRPALPIIGTVRVATGQMTLKDYRFAPLRAVVAFGEGQTLVDLTEAGICGINIPGQIRFAPGGVRLALNPHAAGSVIQDTDQCLAQASITERMQGTLKLDGSIESHGTTGKEVIHNLEGRLDVQISDGRVYNVGAAGFFTNLLAFISVNQLIEGGLPDLRRNDFRYKSLVCKFRLKEGVLHIEEGALKSNSVNIVASGDYGMAESKMNLVLLVSPLTTVDWVVERIPVIGHILQGTLVAVPVGVEGPAANPTVVPLSPTAVGSRLAGILKRTIKTPFRILSPLLKSKPSKDPGGNSN
jgi:uncharacterized protein involved in outer membrane biogenesis